MTWITTYCISCHAEIDVEIPDCEDCGSEEHGCEGCELDRHEALEDALCTRCYHREHPALTAWERNL